LLLPFNLAIFNRPDFRFSHNTTQPENSFSARTFGALVATAVYEESSKNSTESEYSVEDDISEEISDSDFAERSGSSWTAELYYIGLEE